MPCLSTSWYFLFPVRSSGMCLCASPRSPKHHAPLFTAVFRCYVWRSFIQKSTWRMFLDNSHFRLESRPRWFDRLPQILTNHLTWSTPIDTSWIGMVMWVQNAISHPSNQLLKKTKTFPAMGGLWHCFTLINGKMLGSLIHWWFIDGLLMVHDGFCRFIGLVSHKLHHGRVGCSVCWKE